MLRRKLLLPLWSLGSCFHFSCKKQQQLCDVNAQECQYVCVSGGSALRAPGHLSSLQTLSEFKKDLKMSLPFAFLWCLVMSC